MSGPRVTSGTESKQDYATPWELVRAIESRFGPIVLDLAANADNAKAARWYGPGGAELDSLKASWNVSRELMFLNPPFADIAPWAERCARASVDHHARIAFLVPASVGSNWFAEHVHRRALVLALNPRVSFDGLHPFPKDLICAIYGETPDLDVWRWRAQAQMEIPSAVLAPPVAPEPARACVDCGAPVEPPFKRRCEKCVRAR